MDKMSNKWAINDLIRVILFCPILPWIIITFQAGVHNEVVTRCDM